MPQERQKEHKCSHHTAQANRSPWRNFHFSGKVIMCSVLFGLGLVLIGGIIMVIGTEHRDLNNDKSDDQSTIENKAPMAVVGPILMGIGSLIVITGIIMCLFETNICRKREDTRPLIEESGSANTAIQNSTNNITVPSKKNKKHRNHKKSSKHGGSSDNSFENSSSPKPINVHAISSGDFTSSERFLTPSSSLIPPNMLENVRNDENQAAAALLKSFTSSGKSWNTSTEFQTPSSSPHDNSDSFEIKKEATTEITEKKYSLHAPLTSTDSNGSHSEYQSPINSYVEHGIYIRESIVGNIDQSQAGISQNENTVGAIESQEVADGAEKVTDVAIDSKVTTDVQIDNSDATNDQVVTSNSIQATGENSENHKSDLPGMKESQHEEQLKPDFLDSNSILEKTSNCDTTTDSQAKEVQNSHYSQTGNEDLQTANLVKSSDIPIENNEHITESKEDVSHAINTQDRLS